MNELASLGVILLFALLVGHLVKFLRIPEVTGYIFAGVIVGPSVLGWISHENLSTLEVFSEVALGLILFSIGAVFEASRLRASGRPILLVTLTESLLAALLVGGGMLAVGQSWQASLLLGVIAMETAAASTLMVMRECNAAGPLTDALTGLIAINNILCLVGFLVVSAVLDLLQGGGFTWAQVYAALYPLVWQTVGSCALGFLIGLLLAAWASKVVEHGETLILLIGSVLLCVGVSEALALSPLVASLAVGATMVNLSAESRRLFEALSQTDPPLYAIFFVIAGADLNLGLLPSLGLFGLIYVIGRMVGKLAGSRLAAMRVGMPGTVPRMLGLSLLSQAGLAIGLTLAISRRYPDLAPTVNTVVLAAVAVFEIIGPLSARFALVRSNEVRVQPPLPEATALR